MPNYRYSTPEYMRRNNNVSRQASCCRQDEAAVSRANAAVSATDHSCNCDPLSSLPLAMAYVPWQEWTSIYELEKGLQCGTIFKELNKPFRGTGGGQ